jgi:long-chain acyl-CoA synthetase
MEHFYELVSVAVDEFPDNIAIEIQHRDRLEQVTYARLREMAERTAAWLAMIGLDAGQRAAILADNDAAWCAAYLGILRRGAIAVPLDTNYEASQVQTLLIDSGARVMFTTATYLPTIVAARDAAALELKIVLLHGSDPAAVAFEAMVGGNLPPPPLAPCPARPSDPAVLLYTSGTTSDPKGVVLTHANLLAERDGAFAVVRAGSRDAVLGVLPLFHALAQMANLLLPLSIGARVVFLETVNTTELLRALAERGITVFACVPQFFYLIHQRVQGEIDRRGALARSIFKGLLATNRVARRIGWNAGPWLFRRVHGVLGRRMRIMVTGGSKFDVRIGADLYDMGFNILQAYGLTETSGAATLMRPGDPHLETVGHPLPGVEIRIGASEAGDDATTDGEVLIRGPVVMQGYYHRADATAATLDADGWLHSGDLGRLDPEGRLLITGRRKELIVLSSGKNIYPEEIETVYRRSPFIQEICVLGLSRPGEPAAERLYAVVVPNEQLLQQRKIANVGDLLRFEMEGASVYLPHHKRVLGYEIWREPLPRTTTGKVRRFEVERRVRDKAASAEAPGGGPALSEADRAWLERPDVAAVVAAVRKAARPGATVAPDANLELDLGLDSIERVELLTSLEQRFVADIPEEEMQRLYTVRELAESILSHATGDGGEASAAWDALLSPSQIDAITLDAALRPHGLISMAVFAAIKLLRVLLRPGVRVELRGLEHLPATGPLLISPNHQSYLDPFVLLSGLPLRIVRQLFFVGATEYFETRLTRWLAQQVSLVPVDPDAGLVPAMQAGAYGLRRRRILVLFPEGERSIDGTVKHFKKGAAILSQQLQVPITPVAITGLFEIWPRNRPLAWRRLLPGAGTCVRLTFGPPIAPATVVGAGTVPAEAYDVITRELQRRVDDMWRTDAAGMTPAS